MKTTGVSNQPPVSQSKTPDKEKPRTESKSSDKEFKKVLDKEGKPPAPPPKGKYPVFERALPKSVKQQKGTAQEQPSAMQGKEEKKLGVTDRGPREPVSSKEDLLKKKSKEQDDLKEFSVPTHLMMGPAPIHKQTEIQKSSAAAAALNIREIEQIVQKVQVGINEKGLPEMNFELMTDKLGALNLKVSSENDKINIEFVTQDAAAQAELQKGIKELSQLLGERGLNLSETNVMTRDDQSRQQQDRGREDSRGQGSDGIGKGRGRKKPPSGPSDDGSFTI